MTTRHDFNRTAWLRWQRQARLGAKPANAGGGMALADPPAPGVAELVGLPPTPSAPAPARRTLIDLHNAPSSMEQKAAAWAAKAAARG